MRQTALAAFASLLSACGAAPVDPSPAGEPRLQQVASGLSTPLLVTAPRSDSRLFIVEKAGRIRILQGNTLLPTAFLDISGRVSSGSEQGLLGLAFHPNYATNGIFVVNYTDQGGTTKISTFRVSATDPNRADAASEQVGLSIPQPFSNHNGGHLTFGPGLYLYAGLGDGGSAGDPQGNGQNPGTLLGKLLRLQVSATGVISTPTGNPFVGQPSFAWEIWALGLRNPWRFSFDRANEDLYIGDVGQNDREEINVATASGTFSGRGLNFGWSTVEGTRCFRPITNCTTTGFTLPVLEYDHSQGCSVTGGYVYRGAALPELAGLYFYADFCRGWVRSFRLSGGVATEQKEWPTLAPPGAQVTSFGEDAAGELYLTTGGGAVFRIVGGGS